MSSGTAAPNLPGLEDGCREEGPVPGEWQIRAQVCMIPFVPATGTHTHRLHKWSFACEHLPLTQVELWAPMSSPTVCAALFRMGHSPVVDRGSEVGGTCSRRVQIVTTATKDSSVVPWRQISGH